ncbi:MAG: hypothetical protein IT572_03940 [Deltaproteobacteria bacterium]|nr:hypothetical protein [Deltaproteobacteria bacterium]
MNRLSAKPFSPPPGLAASLDAGSAAELAAFALDPHEDLRNEDLLRLARRWRSEGRDERAVRLFAALQEDAFGNAAATAERELAAVAGTGRFGPRFEYLASRFARDLTDYRQLLPMLAAGWAGEIAGAAALVRLGGAGRSAFATRLLAGGAALLVETPVLVGAQRALAADPAPPLHRAWASAWLGLGVMKLFGGLGRGVATRLPARWEFARPALFQTSLFSGLLAARRAEEAAGLRERRADATLLTDTLSSYLGLRLGAGLGRRLLGPSLEPRSPAIPRQVALRLDAFFSTPSPSRRAALACLAFDLHAATDNGSSVGLPRLLGMLALTGLGVYGLWRWAHVPRPKPGEYFYTPSSSERWLLRDFFPFGRVPERISWTAWKRVQGKVLRASDLFDRKESRRFPPDWKRRELRTLAVNVYTGKEYHYLRSNAPVPRKAPAPYSVQADPFPNTGAKSD